MRSRPRGGGFDLVAHVLRLIGLHNIMGDREARRSRHGLAVMHARAKNDRKVAEEGSVANSLRQFQAIDHGHSQIEDPEIKMLPRFGQQPPRLRAVTGGRQFDLRVRAEHIAEQVLTRVFIISDEDFHYGKKLTGDLSTQTTTV